MTARRPLAALLVCASVAEAAPARAFRPPSPVAETLPNGARLVVAENHSLPLVAITVLLGAGTIADAKGKAGLASVVAQAVFESSQARSALEIAAEEGSIGATVSTSAGPETTSIRVECPSQSVEPAIDLVTGLLLHPRFSPDDLERIRNRMLATARDSLEPTRLQDLVDEFTWGAAIVPATAASVRSITPADVAAFYETWYRPQRAVIAISGDVDAAAVMRLLRDRMATWERRAVPDLPPAKPPVADGRVVTLIEQPRSASFAFVCRAPSPASADFVPMQLAQIVLARGEGSWLWETMRERDVLAPTLNVRIAQNTRASALTGTFGLWRAEDVGEGIRDLEQALSMLSNAHRVAPALTRARRLMTADTIDYYETNEGTAARLAWIAWLGLPLDFDRRLLEDLRSIDAARVAAVAAKYLQPGKAALVVAGPRAIVAKALAPMHKEITSPPAR